MSVSTSPGTKWVEYTTTGGSPNGRITITAGYANALNATFGVYPVAFIAQTGGLVVLKNGSGNEHAITAVAGVTYPAAGATNLDGTNTTADNISFWYNDPQAKE